jgi:hypothetical protein
MAVARAARARAAAAADLDGHAPPTSATAAAAAMARRLSRRRSGWLVFLTAATTVVGDFIFDRLSLRRLTNRSRLRDFFHLAQQVVDGLVAIT